MNQTEKKNAVILLSGGMDSTTVLAYTKSLGYRCYCLSFAYGQKQVEELKMARRNAVCYDAEHLVLQVGLDKIGGSALTTDLEVPKDRLPDEMEHSIPVTYVPGRNTIFLSYAIAWAEVIDACDIFIGVNALDYSGYPDCRLEYLRSFEEMANLATKIGTEKDGKFTIHAPLMHLTKKEIVEKGVGLGVDYSFTHSCYDPVKHNDGDVACARCDACQLRMKGFAEAGLDDPIAYIIP